jgi:hypothetical protein
MNNEQILALIQQLLAKNPQMSATDLQNAVMGAGATYNQFRALAPVTQAANNGEFTITNPGGTPVSQFVTGGGFVMSPSVPASGSNIPVQDNTYFLRNENMSVPPPAINVTTPTSPFVMGGGTVPVGAPPNAIPPSPSVTPTQSAPKITDTFSQVDKYLTSNPFQSEYTDPKTGVIYSQYMTGGGAGDDSNAGPQAVSGYMAFDPKTKQITGYDTSGKVTFSQQQDTSSSLSGMLKAAIPIGLSLAFPGLGTAIGSSLFGLTGTAAAMAGGAALGGVTSAATGGNVLAGALLGGAGGYLQGANGVGSYIDPGVSDNIDMGGGQNFGGTPGAISYPVADQTPFSGTSILDPLTGQATYGQSNVGTPNVGGGVDYSLTGNTNPNLKSMGGGQGLVPNPNANLDYMGGGQGITMPISANLDYMGGGQGITTNAAGGGTLGQTGVNTGASLLPTNQYTGQQLGTSLNNINTGVTSPFVTGGGITGTTGTTGTTGSNAGGVLGTGLTAGQIAAIGSGLGSVITGSNTSSAITNAQNLQNAAAATSQNTLSDIYKQNLGFAKPYQDVGVQGANALSSNMPYFQHQFDVNDLNTNLAPNYAFQLGQGQMANQRAANVGGGALSGNTLTGLNRYTQDYAGNAYQQAFNNYDTQRKSIYNTLSGIAGIGNTANAQAIGAGNTYGTNTTNLTTGLAAAQAGANIAQSQNQSNTLNNLINNTALLLSQNNTAPSQGFTTGP